MTSIRRAGRQLWLSAFGFVALMLVIGLPVYLDHQRAVKNHTSRLADQKRTDEEIHQLACAFVSPYPDTIPLVRSFRASYHCPPYDPAIAKQLIPGKIPKSSGTPRPAATPGQHSPTTAPASPTPGPTVTKTRPGAVKSVPGPTQTVPGPTETVTFVPAAKTVTVTKTPPPCLLKPICI